jgi:hypothetical protein
MATLANRGRKRSQLDSVRIASPKSLISGSLVRRPAHADFLIGHDDKATRPLADCFPLKYLLQSFY